MLKGRVYNVNTLNQLPEELNVFTVTSKENENTVRFFGEINPLSNFYPSTFLHEGVHYISSEQLIQANKAKFFGDLETYNQILCCSTSLECKNLSKLIRNMDESKWEEEAGNICFPGIRAKFYQNPVAMDTLLYKTGNKKIIECASDCNSGAMECCWVTKHVWTQQNGFLKEFWDKCWNAFIVRSPNQEPNLIINHPHRSPQALRTNKVFPWIHWNQTII